MIDNGHDELGDSAPGQHQSRAPDNLEKMLTGRLPCVGCGYNLQSISVLGICPECGTAVRATILAKVDPFADELRPILHPRAVALGVVAWSAGALFAALISAYAIGAALVPGSGLGFWRAHFPSWAPVTVQLALVVSALGAVGMVRPHRGVTRAGVAAAVLGALAYAPLIPLAGHILSATSLAAIRGSVDPWQSGAGLTVARVQACLLMIVIIAGLRPHARLLVARSLALRTGRVDRQTMLAMGAAVAVAVVGDLLGFLGTGTTGHAADALRTTGGVLMLFGAALLTLGLAGSMVDCVRIARAILLPPPSLRDVLADEPDDDDPATVGGGQ
ncbi:MAG: hypothetical protein ACT4PL_07120 [Phycisphaerales bacterium]